MALQPGRYQTRNVRIVELTDSFTRAKRSPDGTEQTITVWRGNLLKADGHSLDSVQEWEESNHPNMLGSWLRPGKADGISTEFDLVVRLAA